MDLLHRIRRFDEIGFALVLFAPVSLLFIAAMFTEVLGDRLPSASVASEGVALRQTKMDARAFEQMRRSLTPQAALTNRMDGKFSHE